jgi:hypothetical protein
MGIFYVFTNLWKVNAKWKRLDFAQWQCIYVFCAFNLNKHNNNFNIEHKVCLTFDWRNNLRSTVLHLQNYINEFSTMRFCCIIWLRFLCETLPTYQNVDPAVQNVLESCKSVCVFWEILVNALRLKSTKIFNTLIFVEN